MTVVARIQPRAVRATLKHRKAAHKLTTDEVKQLRNAIKEALRIKDDRGYQFYAGWHGVPFGYCWHFDPLFLPWHRAYLYFFELSLQRIDPEVTLPWWDWSALDGVPKPFRSGALASAPIEPFTNVRRPNWPDRTWRKEGENKEVPPPPYRGLYEHALKAPSFTSFNERITEVHNFVHVWTGGTMSQGEWAAYDPLFWAHHAMVDRVWRIWQHHHPGALPPASILDQPLRPRAITVRQVLDVKQLGYDYAQSAATVPGTR
ncbi:MAG TPA: tyrosinase family protein [Solirubrobacterales bacterium]